MTPEIYCVRGADGRWLVRCRYWREPFTILSLPTQAEAEHHVERWRRIAQTEQAQRREVTHD